MTSVGMFVKETERRRILLAIEERQHRCEPAVLHTPRRRIAVDIRRTQHNETRGDGKSDRDQQPFARPPVELEHRSHGVADRHDAGPGNQRIEDEQPGLRSELHEPGLMQKIPQPAAAAPRCSGWIVSSRLCPAIMIRPAAAIAQRGK
jgi:hypothetical protein